MGTNNGQRGYINEEKKFLNEGNTISFGQDTATMFYQEIPYFTGDKIKILKSKDDCFNKYNAQYFITCMAKAFSSFSWGNNSFSIEIIGNQDILLPTKDHKVDFNFIEKTTAKIEAEHLEKVKKYLIENDMKDTNLTVNEQNALEVLNTVTWSSFNLNKLFGNATRGKRLKSEDRILGNIPFVTAGEADEGVSAFISNEVKVFQKNTITIDMFGSAKYRNYDYGCDDHVAVVHTEELPKYAAIFVTVAIHKSSYNGQFNYGRNFYAKDADDLDILLPVKNGLPDYELMENYISAIHKLMIKKIVGYLDEKNSRLAI